MNIFIHATTAKKTALLLVDVQQECIMTSSTTNIKYAALSYVWGDTSTTKTTSHNIDDLRCPGGLSSIGDEIILPKTIRNAIKLISVLGLHYL